MSELSPTSPAHKQHPDHPDNHPLRKHHVHHGVVLRMSGVFLLSVLFVTFLLGILTNAPIGIVLLSFAASFVFGISVIGFAHADNLQLQHLVATLLVLLVVFGILLSLVSQDTDVIAVMGLNLILGALFIGLLQQSYVHHQKPSLPGVINEQSPEDRDLSSLFEDIIQRSKDLNVAIGRTYSVYKGASEQMRKKIRISSELYNELDADKKPAVLKDALTEISARLALHAEKEKEVFTDAEYRKLSRSKKQTILDALAKKEGEGVLQTHASAVAYVNNALAKFD